MASKSLTFTLIGKDGSASKAIQTVGRAAGGLTKTFAAVGSAIAAAFAVGRIVNFAKATVTEFAAAQDAQNRLSFAFQKFPALAGANIDALRELNIQLQRKTKFDDDAFAAGQATLAQYGLTQKQLEDITPLLADFAARTGQDLPSAADQLGKAILGQGRALKAVGVNFVNAGNAAENFDQIVVGLRQQVGGFAESEGATFVGQLAILSNGFGEIKEKIGSLFAPALLSIASVLYDNVLPALDRLVDRVGPELTKFFESSSIVIGEFFDALSRSADDNSLDPLFKFFDGLGSSAPVFALLGTLGRTLGPILPALSDGLEKVGNALQKEGVLDALSRLIVELLPPLVDLIVAAAPLITFLADVFSGVLVPVLNELVVPALQAVSGAITTIIAGGDLGDWVIGLVDSGNKMAVLAQNIVNLILIPIANGFIDFANSAGDALENFVNIASGLTGIKIDLPRITRLGSVVVGDTSVGTPRGRRLMADGGIVQARDGGLPAVVGEGLYDEAVVPLSPKNLAAMSGGGGGLTVQVTVPGGFVGDERKLTQTITTAIRNGIKRGDIPRGWAGAN